MGGKGDLRFGVTMPQVKDIRNQASCRMPQVKGLTSHVNSIYNGSRFEICGSTGSRVVVQPMLRRAAIAVVLLTLGAGPAAAQKSGGILRVGHFDSPASMSMLEESTARRQPADDGRIQQSGRVQAGRGAEQPAIDRARSSPLAGRGTRREPS